MSETEHPPAPEPEPSPAPADAPQPAPAEPPAPGEEGAQPSEREKEAQARFDKRIGYLRSQLSASQRDRDQFAQRLATLEAQMRGGQQQQAIDPQLQQVIEQEADRRAAAQRTQDRITTFHEAGRAAYADWTERCNDLQAMGADAEIAALLVDMPEGHRVAAALRDAPEEIERIASLRGERARAIALGRFAAQVADTPARNVSRAPRPPPPVQGRVAPRFIEQQATPDQLVEFYSRQAMERRRTH